MAAVHMFLPEEAIDKIVAASNRANKPEELPDYQLINIAYEVYTEDAAPSQKMVKVR
jgi:hypothetical protein